MGFVVCAAGDDSKFVAIEKADRGVACGRNCWCDASMLQCVTFCLDSHLLPQPHVGQGEKADTVSSSDVVVCVANERVCVDTLGDM